jgi:hypothetical protein
MVRYSKISIFLILLILVTSLQPIFPAQETHISVYSKADKYVMNHDVECMIFEHHQKPSFKIWLWVKIVMEIKNFLVGVG